MEYVAFSDESGTGKRFTSIAVFSLPDKALIEVEAQIATIVADKQIREFKWQLLRNAKYCLCAIELIEKVWAILDSFDARVDVLIWDNGDSRNTVFRRDDIANYGRMFFHLHSNVLRRRSIGSIWRLFPDERIEIDWNSVRDCISAVGRRPRYVEDPLFGGFFCDLHYEIRQFEQVKSYQQPCCQIADLYAGLVYKEVRNLD